MIAETAPRRSTATVSGGVEGANPGERSSAAAAAALYERYYDRVYGYCLYKLGNREEAEDAAQTTFLWALRALERGVVPRLEANWIFTIAQNSCRTRVRSRGRLREVPSDPQVLQEVAPGRAPARDELVGLEEALQDMPDLQRRAILLREWRGCSYREIAEELGLTSAAVETLIFRARRSLAQRLEQPPVATRRRAGVFALDVGSIASGLKAVLGIGSGAKLGAAAAGIAALAIGFGLPGDSGRHQSALVGPRVHPSPAVEVRAEQSKLPTERGGEPRPERGARTAPARPSEPGVDAMGRDLGRTLDRVTSSVPVPDVVGTLGGVQTTVAQVTAPLTTAVDPVVGVTVPELLP